MLPFYFNFSTNQPTNIHCFQNHDRERSRHYVPTPKYTNVHEVQIYNTKFCEGTKKSFLSKKSINIYVFNISESEHLCVFSGVCES